MKRDFNVSQKQNYNKLSFVWFHRLLFCWTTVSNVLQKKCYFVVFVQISSSILVQTQKFKHCFKNSPTLVFDKNIYKAFWSKFPIDT